MGGWGPALVPGTELNLLNNFKFAHLLLVKNSAVIIISGIRVSESLSYHQEQ